MTQQVEQQLEKQTQLICKILSDKKAKNITIVDISHLTIVADKFVICNGQSTTQVKALAGHVEEIMEKEHGQHVIRIEGKSDGKWAVLDYGGIIVHIFLEEIRELYSLEKLWSDGLNIKKYED